MFYDEWSPFDWGLTAATGGKYGMIKAATQPQGPSGLPGDPYGGMAYPTYEAGYDPNAPENVARVADQKKQFAGLNKSISDLKGYASNRGDSPWAMMQKQKVYADEKAGRDVAAAKAGAAAAGGMSNLAQTGGLTSGARERLSAGAAQNALDMGQDVARAGDSNRLQVGINDQQNKVQTLNAIPGMESSALNSWTNFDNAETGRRTNENMRRNDFNTKLVDMQNQRIANERQAQATMQAGKKNILGSWLCSHAFPGAAMGIWRPLLEFRKYAVEQHQDIARFYLEDCGELVPRMVEAGADMDENRRFVANIVSLVKQGKMEEAYVEYENKFFELMDKYWPECNHPVYLNKGKAA